ncbi:S-layer homology domain-containing protein [Deinococcus taklimakanensis]|uniref:S-layer homology domain-containing protein n=1 Tax=Deinococcus taklimakanensis TaxID=536443 RepID=A0ABW5P1K3_9DEIO
MKKSLLILTAALTFGNMAAAQTSATASAPQVPALTDVPAGHWAKDAIDKLISRGIILGYPDGTYRGTQNLTRYEAAVIIARLLEQIQNGSTTVTDSETVTALQNAVQELAADLAALGVRVTDLEENAVSKDDFARLEERVNGLGAANGDPEALAGIQAQIDELTARADEYDALRADVDDNASSIAALNDLTVLLNQDILDLQDRVTGIDAALVDVDTRITGIDTRVTKLENAPKFTVGGTLAANYGRLALVQGTTNFDISRLTNSTFAAGVFDAVANSSKVTTHDIPQSYGSSLGFGIKASQLITADGAVIVNNAEVNFGTLGLWDVNFGSQPIVVVSNALADGTINGQKFKVRYDANDSLFKFNDYLFNNNDVIARSYGIGNTNNRRGIVATIEATTLPLNPTLTIVTGNANGPAMTGMIPTVSANYYGIRAGVKPTGIGDFGVSYAQVDGFRSAFGVDFNANLGPINLLGAGVVSSPNNGTLLTGQVQNYWDAADKAGYVEARADLGMVKFGANYRAIDPQFAIVTDPTKDFTVANAGMSTKNSMPYTANQVGYGAALGTNLGPVALGAYVDSSTRWIPAADGSDRVTGFGVKAGGKLGALELVAYYNSLTVGGKADNGAAIATGYATDNAYLTSNYNNNTNGAGMGIAKVPMAMTSTVGGQLSHDGAAENALVKGLNFTIGDAYFYNTATNSLYVYGDYTGTLGGFTVNPMFRYRLVTDASDAAAYAAAPTAANAAIAGSSNFNTIKYGVKIASPVLTSVPFQPSLYANFANRISNVGTGMGIAANGTTTTELLGQVGIGFNNFIVDGVSAKVGYSYYQGFGIAKPVPNVGAGDFAFVASDDRIYGTRDLAARGAIKLDGITTQLAWSGLTANYGVFRYYDLANGDKAPTSVAQGFKVGYTFKF